MCLHIGRDSWCDYPFPAHGPTTQGFLVGPHLFDCITYWCPRFLLAATTWLRWSVLTTPSSMINQIILPSGLVIALKLEKTTCDYPCRSMDSISSTLSPNTSLATIKSSHANWSSRSTNWRYCKKSCLAAIFVGISAVPPKQIVTSRKSISFLYNLLEQP